jgi:SAM-dependent methyltransferase
VTTPKHPPAELYRSKLSDPYSSHRRIIALTRSLPSVHRVLDVGCGPGYIGSALAGLGYSVVGVDSHADTNSLRSAGYVEAFRLDIEQASIPLQDSFDLLIFADVLEHLRDPEEVLERFRTLLVPGGHILLSVPNVAHWTVRVALLAGYFPSHDRGILDRTHIRFFTLDSARQMVRRAEFSIRHAEVTPIPLPLIWPTTAEGRPLDWLQHVNGVLTQLWKRGLGYQILILADLIGSGHSA